MTFPGIPPEDMINFEKRVTDNLERFVEHHDSTVGLRKTVADLNKTIAQQMSMIRDLEDDNALLRRRLVERDSSLMSALKCYFSGD